VSVGRIEAGFDPSGNIVAWRHRSVALTIASIFGPDPKHEAPFELRYGARQSSICRSKYQTFASRTARPPAQRLIERFRLGKEILSDHRN
jgi:hypothetical protein